eukprot:8340904-Lingulodinium_polyedra.AAC.1
MAKGRAFAIVQMDGARPEERVAAQALTASGAGCRKSPLPPQFLFIEVTDAPSSKVVASTMR